MTKEAQSSKLEQARIKARRLAIDLQNSDFGFRTSFAILVSSFGLPLKTSSRSLVR